jgi:N-acetylglucosamine kinase-like BadF-type ATPase
MIIIADSGSTKTNWKIMAGGKIKTIKTSGINPYYQNRQEIEATIEKELIPKLESPDEVKEVHFYGAGIGNEKRKKDISIPLHFIFRNAEIEVEHDLLGAARALLGDKAGIACIAGTGSNSCLYDGKAITDNVESLGLYLGDEGSGGYKGKILIKDYLRGNMPENILQKFEEKYPERASEIMEAIYRKSYPNRYLASFMPFITENQKDPYIKALIYDSFSQLFDNCLSHYSGWENLKVSFTGSVAFHLQKQLKAVAKEKGFKTGIILADPMDTLTDYHLKK